MIEVHHKVPLNSIGSDYVVDGRNDLIPICPNCHRMIHRLIRVHPELVGDPSVERMKEIVKSRNG